MSSIFSPIGVFKDAWKTAEKHIQLLAQVCVTIALLQFLNWMFAVEHIKSSTDMLSSVISVAAALAASVCGIGFTVISLKLVRGTAAHYRDIVPSWHLIWNYLLASILSALCIILGLIALIIPGVYLILAFSMSNYVLIDGANPLEALKKSFEITKGVKWQLLVFILLVIVINLIGAIFLVGLLVTVPVSMLAIAHVYERLQKREVSL